MNQLETWKGKEREQQDRISDDAKELEKMSNKQSLLLKKVRFKSHDVHIFISFAIEHIPVFSNSNHGFVA